ncbi:MAG: peptide-methionine (S)-S-oxide reductase MsrA [Bacteroidetes bacterium]|jgi:peptide-methionine (S)-S-oxide reductase|nr:peptide-methionine (S)-S-oxide reductase MsrA [Bacteroidota bacterium]
MNNSKLITAIVLAVFVGSAVLLGIDYLPAPTSDANAQEANQPPQPAVDIDPAVADTATFAGGCFWCMEPPYDTMDGVAATLSGYAGGNEPNPSYREVASGQTGHAEVVQVIYDSTLVSYTRLLQTYWRNIDPLDNGGQFCDRGSPYRPVIFVHDEQQRELAAASKEVVAQRFDAPIVVPIEPLEAFYRAEAYHQNFYTKNPDRYYSYRRGCRRDARLEELWGDMAGQPGPLSTSD